MAGENRSPGSAPPPTAIPFLDLRTLHEPLRPAFHAALDAVLDESAFVGAGPSALFERQFAALSGLGHAAGCGSGTDALALALRALGIEPGDEVIVPAMTFVATAEAVVHVGATPVLADVEPTTLLLDAASVDAVRTARTRAVVPVHLYGHVVPLDRLDAWRHDGLLVLEDAAQAHLATWGGRPVGTAGHAAAFSFYPGKNLGALGDAGAVLSDDADLVARVATLRDHGSGQKYLHDEVGWCSRLDGIQAAFLGAKLDHLPAWTERRRQLAEAYREAVPAGLLVPWDEGAVHHLLVARVPADRRDAVRQQLATRGIGTGVHYPIPLSRQPALAPWRRSCPNAERAAAEVLSLPMDPSLQDDDVKRVVAALLEVLDAPANA